MAPTKPSKRPIIFFSAGSATLKESGVAAATGRASFLMVISQNVRLKLPGSTKFLVDNDGQRQKPLC